MRPEAAEWLNRAGILLDLVAFLFAAPELLGGRRQKALVSVYERGLRLLPPIALAASLVALGTFLAAAAGWIRGQIATAAWRGSIVTVSAVLPTLVGIIAVRLGGQLSADLLARSVETDDDLGQRLLSFGAFLFVLGMALQLLATF